MTCTVACLVVMLVEEPLSAFRCTNLDSDTCILYFFNIACTMIYSGDYVTVILFNAPELSSVFQLFSTVSFCKCSRFSNAAFFSVFVMLFGIVPSAPTITETTVPYPFCYSFLCSYRMTYSEITLGEKNGFQFDH